MYPCFSYFCCPWVADKRTSVNASLRQTTGIISILQHVRKRFLSKDFGKLIQSSIYSSASQPGERWSMTSLCVYGENLLISIFKNSSSLEWLKTFLVLLWIMAVCSYPKCNKCNNEQHAAHHIQENSTTQEALVTQGLPKPCCSSTTDNSAYPKKYIKEFLKKKGTACWAMMFLFSVSHQSDTRREHCSAGLFGRIDGGCLHYKSCIQERWPYMTHIRFGFAFSDVLNDDFINRTEQIKLIACSFQKHPTLHVSAS